MDNSSNTTGSSIGTNNMNGDDSRKKRDNAQAQEPDDNEENPKKVRVQPTNKQTVSSSPRRRSHARDATSRYDSPNQLKGTEGNNVTSSSSVPAPSNGSNRNITNNIHAASYQSNIERGRQMSRRRIFDIESALMCLAQFGGNENCREYLSNEKNSWVTFRVGHAGDASTIANLYRQSKHLTDMVDETPELEKRPARMEGEDEAVAPGSMLEVWLADGMGDEGTPPMVHSLLAQVHQTEATDPSASAGAVVTSDDSMTSGKTKTTLGAVSLLTVAWENNERVLRVEWLHIDPSLPTDVATTLEQRLWLRLSTLSVMTACQVVSVEEQVIHSKNQDDTSTTARLPASAE